MQRHVLSELVSSIPVERRICVCVLLRCSTRQEALGPTRQKGGKERREYNAERPASYTGANLRSRSAILIIK